MFPKLCGERFHGQTFFTKAKVSELQNYRGQMVKKRLDLRCELWGETNMVKEKVVEEKVKLKL